MIEVGRVCIKTAGREAGSYCTVVKKIDVNFVMVAGPKSLTGVKRRRCNVVHLEPLTIKLHINADATDAEIQKEYEKAGILEKVKTAAPVPQERKQLQPVKKAEKPVEVKEEKAAEQKPAKKTAKKEAAEKAEEKEEHRAEHKEGEHKAAAKKPAKATSKGRLGESGSSRQSGAAKKTKK